MEPEHHGKYLVMHMETHEYEIDNSLAQAILRMLERFPDTQRRKAALLWIPRRLPNRTRRTAIGEAAMPIHGRVNGDAQRITIRVSVSNGEQPYREIEFEVDTASDEGAGYATAGHRGARPRAVG